jgi:hypothetical protein
MSLKALHIVFILASMLLCVAFGAWAVLNFEAEGGGTLAKAYVTVPAVALVGLAVYGWYFLRKLKNVSYL